MVNITQRLVHHTVTTLGFVTLLPGSVMMLWFYTASVGLTQELHTIAVALTSTGALCLLTAITLRVLLPLNNPRGLQYPQTQPQGTHNNPESSVDLSPVPPYHVVVTGAPGQGVIWTLPQPPLGQDPEPTPPPVYEAVFGEWGVGQEPHKGPQGSRRRVESDGDAQARAQGLGGGSPFTIEPLTPPPVYENTTPSFTYGASAARPDS